MITRHLYYVLDDDNHAQPVDMWTWARWFEEHRLVTGKGIVGWTQITSQVWVSTVFLGLDHRHYGEGPPLLFETMVFDGHGRDARGLDQWRYSSWDDAEAGHKAAVRKAREALGQRITEERTE